MPQLIAAIEAFSQQHNTSTAPYVSAAKADDILAKVAQARAVLNKTPSA